MSDEMEYRVTINPRLGPISVQAEAGKRRKGRIERDKPLACFCSNKPCMTDISKLYSVVDLGDGVMMEAPRESADCPVCGHALFWSRAYEKREMKGF